MKHLKALAGGLSLLLCSFFALPAAAHAQTVTLNLVGVGSSALFLESGEAAQSSSGAGGLNLTCGWSFGSNAVQITDTSVVPSATDTGNVWIAWTTGGGSGTCSSLNTSGTVNVAMYLQTDSVVGDRCLFNTTHCTFGAGTSGSPTTLTNADLVDPPSSTQATNVPTAVWNALTGQSPNTAGTDIRPEDAEFAITRALTSCGTNVGTWSNKIENSAGTVVFPAVLSTSQYLGLGYTNGGAIDGLGSTSGSSSTFNVVSFGLPASYSVYPVGAAPIVVFVQTDGTTNGFGDPSIFDINRSTLALYLDGTLGSTNDALFPGTSAVGTPAATTVFLREPLSGTYNTMEYNIPNSLELETSQDVGNFQVPFSSGKTFNQNCNGSGAPEWNTAGTTMGVLATSGSPKRLRAIGTGAEVAQVLLNTNSLGYAFWSVSNFKNATENTKYLTVDGVDPLFSSYNTGDGGAIPTAPEQLSLINFQNVRDGKYPIWSLLRLVCTSTCTPANNFSSTIQGFVSFGDTANVTPDFVPVNSPSFPSFNMGAIRSHFLPSAGTGEPTLNLLNNGGCPTTGSASSEVGGDVGGVVIPCAVSNDFITDYNHTYSPYDTTGGNQFVSRRN